MDAAAIVENAGNSGRERRLGKGCEHVQTWSGVFHSRLENASRFPRAPTGLCSAKSLSGVDCAF